jgi:hypothetical protein
MHHKKVKMFNFRRDTLLHVLNAAEPEGAKARPILTALILGTSM